MQRYMQFISSCASTSYQARKSLGLEHATLSRDSAKAFELPSFALYTHFCALHAAAAPHHCCQRKAEAGCQRTPTQRYDEGLALQQFSTRQSSTSAWKLKQHIRTYLHPSILGKHIRHCHKKGLRAQTAIPYQGQHANCHAAEGPMPRMLEPMPNDPYHTSFTSPTAHLSKLEHLCRSLRCRRHREGHRGEGCGRHKGCLHSPSYQSKVIFLGSHRRCPRHAHH